MIRKLSKNSLRLPYRLLSKTLQSVENHLIQRDYEPSYSPIFIIGVPRSGTTLLYMVIIHSLEVCYFSNLMARYSNFPCILSYFLSLINTSRPPGNFNSWYGEVSGWRAASQAQSFWARWFPGEDQNHCGPDGIPDSAIKRLRNTILLLQKIYKNPFANKALSLGVRILPLFRAFPESLFVRVHRDHLDTAQSILKGREEYAGDKNRWISAKPSEYHRIEDKDYITEVCGQIYYIEKDMDRGIQSIGEDRCINVHYKDLCKNPKSVVSAIVRFYNQNSCKEPLRRKNRPPDPFHYSEGMKCCDDEYKKLKECLNNFFGAAERNYNVVKKD